MNKFQNWTLFLDRDGVINRRIVNDYVKRPAEFHFIENVPQAIRIFSTIFDKIIVVTNQQGIGKGLMTVHDLDEVHSKMKTEIEDAGGHINHIFFAPELAGMKSFFRKPNIGMGLKAKKQFPSIQFKQSVMVGDSLGDMQFGKRLGMTTVLVGDNQKIAKDYPKIVDYYFSSLFHFAEYILKN